MTSTLENTATTQLIPLGQLISSALNPRKHFDEASLKDLAANLAGRGLLQNLVVRPHPLHPGQYEIVAGERRYRALKILAGENHPIAQQPVKCEVRELTDRELVEIATAENMSRKDMTPMEECQAFADLLRLGSDKASLALQYNTTERTIARKAQIAESLSSHWQEQLNQKKITLAFAEALCLCSKKTQKEIQDIPWIRDPAQLEKHLKKGRFAVKDAKFDVQYAEKQHKLKVIEDLYGDIEPFFANKEKALNLQQDWAQERAMELRKSKKYHFVEVITHPEYWHPTGDLSWIKMNPEDQLGRVILVSSSTGAVEEKDVYKTVKSKTTTEPEEKPKDPFTKQGHHIAHQARAEVYRTWIAHNPKQAVIHAIIGLLEDSYSGMVRIRTGETHHFKIDALHEALQKICEQHGIDLYEDQHLKIPSQSWYDSPNLKCNQLYDSLDQLELPEVLSIFAHLMAPFTADWHHEDERKPRNPLMLHVARKHNLTTAGTFKLTEAFLKACSQQMIATISGQAGVAGEMGVAITKKEKINKLLGFSDRLQQEGYVPDIATFNKVDP